MLISPPPTTNRFLGGESNSSWNIAKSSIIPRMARRLTEIPLPLNKLELKRFFRASQWAV